MKKPIVRNKIGFADFDHCIIRIDVQDTNEDDTHIAGSTLSDRAWKFFNVMGEEGYYEDTGVKTAHIYGKKRCMRGWNLHETDYHNHGSLYFEVNHVPTVAEVQEMTRRTSLMLLKPLTKKEREIQA